MTRHTLARYLRTLLTKGWHGKHKWFQETYFGTLKITKWFGECRDEFACSLVYSADVYGFLG